MSIDDVCLSSSRKFWRHAGRRSSNESRPILRSR